MFLEKSVSMLKKVMNCDTIRTAKAMLGMKLILSGENLGKIVETEAYLGTADSACHSSNGRRSPKNESMYLSAGHWYVYQIYGYQMLNLVTRPKNIAEAVLIRALESPSGDVVSNGPGKLTRFCGISQNLDGKLIEESDLKIIHGKIPKKICQRARIGVTCEDEWRNKPLCFYVKGNKHVSKVAKRELIEDSDTWK